MAYQLGDQIIIKKYLKMKLQASLVVAGILSACVSAAPIGLPDTGKPYDIDQTHFYGSIVDPSTHELIGTTPWFIEFYSPWCPHC